MLVTAFAAALWRAGEVWMFHKPAPFNSDHPRGLLVGAASPDANLKHPCYMAIAVPCQLYDRACLSVEVT